MSQPPGFRKFLLVACIGGASLLFQNCQPKNVTFESAESALSAIPVQIPTPIANPDPSSGNGVGNEGTKVFHF